MGKVLAIIPARGGSKRIPRKNIKDFCGQLIIKYSIDASIKSELFNEIMVSTEDQEIAKIAKSMGAKVPFLRSAKNSDDYASTADVILEVLNVYEKLDKHFDYVCCIYPTAPFITSDLLIKGFNLLTGEHADSVFPVVKFSYPIQRSLKIDNGKLKMIWPENYFSRSQDLMSVYHDAGQFYWLNVKSFLDQKILYTKNAVPLELSELEVQDIDNLDDWRLAEFKFKFYI